MTNVLTRMGRGRPASALAWLPIVLAMSAVTMQILYPRFDGAERDLLTVWIVVAFAAASLTHAAITTGARTAGLVAAVFAGGGLLIEVVGVATGFPFGTYEYSDRLGPQVGEVPLIIPLAWSMLGYPSLVVARLVTGSRWLGTLIGATALAAWDLFLDPQMVTEGYWTWSGTGPNLIGTVPATNYLAWLGTAWLMMMALWHVTDAWSPLTRDFRVPVGLYIWTWVGSTVAHVWFLDLPQSALYGFMGMGLVTGMLVWALRAPLLLDDDPTPERAVL